MRKFLMIAACGALAACGSNEAETTTEPAEPMDTTVAQTDTASASQMAGTYEMTMEDGTVMRQQINADGTYVDSDVSGNELSRGTWRQQGDQLCLDEQQASVAVDAVDGIVLGGGHGALVVAVDDVEITVHVEIHHGGGPGDAGFARRQLDHRLHPFAHVDEGVATYVQE